MRVYLPRDTDVTGSLVLRMQAGSAQLHYKGTLSHQGIPSGNSRWKEETPPERAASPGRWKAEAGLEVGLDTFALGVAAT